MTKKIIAASIFLSFALTGVAFADLPSTIVALPTGLTTQSDVFVAINTIANWIFTILLITSVVIILLAAFQFVTSGHDPVKVTEARQKILYAAVGIVVALLAKAFPTLLQSIIK